MLIIDNKLIMVRVPRSATTHLQMFFDHFKLAHQHPGHLHRPASSCSFGFLPTFATIQDPERWYRSFWRYFIDPPSTIQTNPLLRDCHLELANGDGFKGWLQRVTSGAPIDLNTPFLLPLSPRGEGGGTDSFPHPFWADRESRGGGLYTYVWRFMTDAKTIPIRVCDLHREIRKCMLMHDVEWTDAMDDWWDYSSPTNALKQKPKLDADMVSWIRNSEQDIYDGYRPDGRPG